MASFRNSHAAGRRGRGNRTPLLLAAAAGCFAVVAATVHLAGGGSSAGEADDARPSVADSRSQAGAGQGSGVRSPGSDDRKSRIEDRDPSSLVPHPSSSLTQAGSNSPLTTDQPNPQLSARVEAHLAAGEFGPALKLAESAADAGERDRLLRLVAHAQWKLDEFDAARATLRRMENSGEFDADAAERAGQPTAAGGAMANFDELIQLIQQHTTGPWMEVDGAGGTISQFSTNGGILVDPRGMLHRVTREEHHRRLAALGLRARKADLNENMARPSPLRMVSLTRLEREAARRLADGLPATASMKNLAGLTKVQYIFVYPDEHEVVIAGPAEGWRYNEYGQPIGEQSGRPTLQLDDFVTVFRTFQPGGVEIFRCSFEPREENLRNVRQFAENSRSRGPLSAGAGVRNFVRRLERLLGEFDVDIGGVPQDSRVARVMVEADYRLKLIGLERLQAAGIPSYFDLLPLDMQQNPAATSVLRWWLTMKYDAVLHSSDRNVFHLVGSSVECKSENELLTAAGKRVPTGRSEPVNRLFAREFTGRYEKLAAEDLVFADLQNIFDLALVAALLRHEGIDEKLDWHGGVFSPEGGYEPARFEPVQSVQAVAGHRVYRGRDVVVQVAGGVTGDLMSVARNEKIRREQPRLGTVRPPSLPADRWWWDAAE